MIDRKKIEVLVDCYKNNNYPHILSYLGYETQCGDGLANIKEINELFKQLAVLDDKFKKVKIKSVKDINKYTNLLGHLWTRLSSPLLKHCRLYFFSFFYLP